MNKKLSEDSIKTLERLEGNYKLIYTVLMSAPLIVALENFSISSDTAIGVKSLRYISQFSLENVLVFILFLLIHTRFYLGDLRYLDLKYLHSQGNKSYLKRYSSLSRVIDFYSLIIHAILFYFLAAALNDFVLFYKIFTIILFANAVWLMFVYLVTDKISRERYENRCTNIWIINNLVCTICLVAFYKFSGGLSNPYSVYILAIFVVLNTVFDYAMTWNMYFPKIKETEIAAD